MLSPLLAQSVKTRPLAAMPQSSSLTKQVVHPRQSILPTAAAALAAVVVVVLLFAQAA